MNSDRPTPPLDLDLSPNGRTPPTGVPAFSSHDIRTIVAQQINLEIQSQVAEAMGGGGPPGGGSPPNIAKTYLGDSARGWGASALKALLGFCALAFAWYMSVNTGLADRYTKTETKAIVNDTVEQRPAHPDTKLILQAHTEGIKKLSAVQIRQTIIIENQAKAVEKNEKKIERLERRRNR